MEFLDVPYLCLIFVATVLAVAANAITRIKVPVARCLVGLPYSLLALTLALFSGLRAVTVGTDTPTMSRIFGATPADSLGSAFATRQQEYGYVTLMYLLRQRTENPRWLLMVVSIATVSIVLVSLWHTSPAFGLSVFLYVALGDFVFTISGMRQGLAIALVLAAWAGYRNRALSITLSVVAVFIHTSAIVAALVLLFLPLLKPNKRWLTAILVSSAVGLSAALTMQLLGGWVGFLNERYLWYLRNQDAGGIGSWVMLAAYLFGVLITYQYALNAKPRIQQAWALMSISLVFLAFGTQITDMRRLALYFTIFAPVFFAAFLVDQLSIAARFFVGVGLLIYFTRYLRANLKLLPYSWSPELVHGEILFAIVAAATFSVSLLAITAIVRARAARNSRAVPASSEGPVFAPQHAGPSQLEFV